VLDSDAAATGAADRPESRGFVAHDARRPHRAPLGSSARRTPPHTPPPQTRSAWVRRAGGLDRRRLPLVSGAG
jgi:hypothetical protein